MDAGVHHSFSGIRLIIVYNPSNEVVPVDYLVYRLPLPFAVYPCSFLLFKVLRPLYDPWTIASGRNPARRRRELLHTKHKAAVRESLQGTNLPARLN